MTIGIDISMLVYQGSGVATYTTNLVMALLKYHPEHSYKLFYSSLRKPPQVIEKLEEFRTMGAKVYALPIPPRFLKLFWNKLHIIPVEWFIGKVDVYHSSDFLRPPLMQGTKGVTTVHDLTWRLFPKYHTSDIIEAHERKIQMTIKKGDMVIADSENTKKDLLKVYPKAAEANRIQVLHLGIDDRYKKISLRKCETIIQKYTIDYSKRYILYVGAIEPRKNVDRAVKIYAELIKKRDFADVEFLIIGRAGWKNEKVFETIQKKKVQDKVHFVGYVPDEDLPYFYSFAEVLIYLSSYEGFGLPPLEAGACGTPTLLYKNSSLREIMPKGYPFTEEGKELNTLQKLLRDVDSGKSFKTESVSWKTYAKNFLKYLL